MKTIVAIVFLSIGFLLITDGVQSKESDGFLGDFSVLFIKNWIQFIEIKYPNTIDNECTQIFIINKTNNYECEYHKCEKANNENSNISKLFQIKLDGHGSHLCKVSKKICTVRNYFFFKWNIYHRFWHWRPLKVFPGMNTQFWWHSKFK